jgi:hypothetical protein
MISSSPRSMKMRVRNTLIGLGIYLFLGSVACGCYSLYWFAEARSEKRLFENRLQARQEPSNKQAEGVMTMFGMMSGVGPRGMDNAVAAKMFEMEKYAWKYLFFTLALGVGGYHLFQAASERHRSLMRAEPLPPE